MLGRQQILKLVKEQDLIENFDDACLGGAGYDLRVDRIYELRSGSAVRKSSVETPSITEIDFDLHKLQANAYILVETCEKVNIPEGIVARILPRSSVFRCGCMLITALVDPGFQGTLTMGLKNVSAETFKLERKSPIAQIVFEPVKGETTPYSGKYQGGKVV